MKTLAPDRVPTDIAAVQTRTVWALVAGQILGGLGIGATLSIGAILAAHVSGNDAVSGTAATFSTLGAAAAAIPLARLAARLGRRLALTTGTLTAALGSVTIVIATGAGAFPLLLLGFAFLGVGSAVNLQSRFAATDLADPLHRGRQLSLVVWSTTIGSVVGPNLSGPGETIAQVLGMPHLTGSFAIAITAQLLAVVVYLVALRPDPYLLSRTLMPAASAAPTGDASVHGSAGAGSDEDDAGARDTAAASSTVHTDIHTRRLIIFAIAAIAASHLVMVAVMSMTPLHMTHHGSTIGAIGFTISLHIAGMYALSPVFGWLSDKIGRFATVLIGQGLLAVGLAVVALGELDASLVTVGLAFIGLGWSATTVAGSALVSDLASGDARPRIQGRSDLTMNLAGAVGGASAGPVLALVGYAGLAAVAAPVVLAVAIATLVTMRTVRVSTPADA
jgi:MFS family permease